MPDATTLRTNKLRAVKIPVIEKPHALPNPEEYLSDEQRWDAIAALLESMVWRQMEGNVENDHETLYYLG